MNKLYTALLMAVTLCATEIPTQKVQMHDFYTSTKINAQVIQLSNAKEAITSIVSGHLEAYYVKPAQVVKKGQKIALIESMEISRMTAQYLALKQQLQASQKNYDSLQKLYDKGMASMAQLNNEAIKKDGMEAKLNTLASQLATLGIATKNLHKATAQVVLHAHSSGKVSALLKPLHSALNANEPIVTVAKEQAYYLQGYIPLRFATKLHLGDKLVFAYGGQTVVTHITQIMPKIDEETQRVVVLASIETDVKNLFIGLFVEATLFMGQSKRYKAIRRSALSFFNNEWVVFVPKEEHEAHEEDHEEEHEHEEHSAPYGVQVVKIITQDEEFVAVDGLEVGQEYVSEKSYFVKSLILKSSLGENGH